MAGRRRKRLIGSGIKAARNPMLEPVVLTRFFELCSLEDLSSFRLVSKSWYELSLTRWRTYMTIVVNKNGIAVDDDGLDDIEDDDNPSNQDRDLSQLFNGNEWNRLNSKPYQSYKLTLPSLTSRHVLMEKIGLHMRRLALTLVVVEKRHICIEALKTAIFVDTPNLENLSLDIIIWRGGHTEHTQKRLHESEIEAGVVNVQPNLKFLKVKFNGSCPLPVLLLRHFPNIEKLAVAECFINSQLLELVEILEFPRLNNGQKMVIKFLDIANLRLQDQEVVKRLLEVRHLKLETLRFGMRSCETAPHTVLPRAIQLHGATLKKLYLRNYPVDTRWAGDRPCHRYLPSYTSFPSAPHGLLSLTELHLDGKVFSNLYFLEQTPNLKILHITQLYEENEMIVKETTDESRVAAIVLPGVTELYFTHLSSYGKVKFEDQLEVLTRLMPNVKRLKAPLSTGALKIVCEKWKQLTYLDTFKGVLSDSVVTGQASKEQQEIDPIPNLTDLKDLQILTIEKARQLTDKSIYNGFLKMPHLHTLNVTLSEKVSVKAFKTLFKKFPMTDQLPIPSKPVLRKRVCGKAQGGSSSKRPRCECCS